jgi:hypothetical protein
MTVKMCRAVDARSERACSINGRTAGCHKIEGAKDKVLRRMWSLSALLQQTKKRPALLPGVSNSQDD